MLNGKKGFTLIELVIVIAVIAIVIGAALPRLSAYSEKQTEANRDNQEYVVNKAIKQYYALTGAYPKYSKYIGSDGVFNDEKFAADLATKTGAMIDAATYNIVYYEAAHDDKPPHYAEVKMS